MQFVIKLKDGFPTGYPLAADNLRLIIPTLPSGYLTEKDLQGTGYAGFTLVPKPAPSDPTKEIKQVPPTDKSEDGCWLQKWKEVDRADLTHEQRETLIKQHLDRQANNVRQDRNELLAASDWTQTKDIPDEISALWSKYRQELRDIPQQPGFPWEINWPTKPEENWSSV